MDGFRPAQEVESMSGAQEQDVEMAGGSLLTGAHAIKSAAALHQEDRMMAVYFRVDPRSCPFEAGFKFGQVVDMTEKMNSASLSQTDFRRIRSNYF